MRTAVALGLCSLLGLGACSRPAFEYVVQADLAKWPDKTVALDPRADVVYILEGKRPVDADAHRKAVMADLETRGFRLVPPGQASLWVDVWSLIPASAERGSEAATRSKGEGGGHGKSGGRGGEGSHRGGSGMALDAPRSGNLDLTLVVQFLERENLRLVWRGTGTLTLKERIRPDGTLSPEAEVRRLLEPLPARIGSRTSEGE